MQQTSTNTQTDQKAPRKTPRRVPRPVFSPATPYEELPEWLTLQQVAQVLGVCYQTAYQMVQRRELKSGVVEPIPHRRFGPKLIFISKEELFKCAPQRARETPAETELAAQR